MGYKINLKNFEKALKGTGGIYLAIAKNLGVARQSVVEYLKRTPKAMDLWVQEREGAGDMTEGSLLIKVKSGDLGAIKYFLSTQFKNRGYVERQEVEHSGEFAPVRIEIVKPDGSKEEDKN